MTSKEKTFFVAVALFLIVGNLPRFIPLTIGFGNVNMGEVILYILTAILFPARVFRVMKSAIGRVLITGTAMSLAIGIYKWGADLSSASYAIRFIIQISISAIIGETIAREYGKDISTPLQKYFLAYFIIALAALALLAAFPDSAVLWAALASIGVEFTGDPHIGRLISLYFDPNFYAVIVTLPISLLYADYAEKRKTKTLIFFLILTGTILLTVSRSGIALLFMIAMFFGGKGFIRSIYTLKIKKTTARNFVLMLAALAIVIVASQDQVDRLIQRLSSGVGDDSSTARYDSFVIGMDLFFKEPLLGFGYNFLNPFLAESNRLGLDSSLQVLFVTYGALLSMGMITLICWHGYKINRRIMISIKSSGPKENKSFNKTWSIFRCYVILCLVWASHFNQIIFYPFWIIPILSMLFYFEFIGLKNRRYMVN